MSYGNGERIKIYKWLVNRQSYTHTHTHVSRSNELYWRRETYLYGNELGETHYAAAQNK